MSRKKLIYLLFKTYKKGNNSCNNIKKLTFNFNIINISKIKLDTYVTYVYFPLSGIQENLGEFIINYLMHSNA